MDYLALQADAKRSNRLLVTAFFLIVVVVAIAAATASTVLVWGVAALLDLIGHLEAEADSLPQRSLVDQVPWAWVWGSLAGGAGAIIAWITSARETALRRHGGTGIARSLGGRRISHQSHDRRERRFVNAVEEIAIAARQQAPKVYVLDREQGINAFNAGWTDDSTVIGITAGALESLSHDELQAVAAQAMSHVFHGDARLNLRLMAMVTGVAGIAILGERWIEAATPAEDSDDGPNLPLFAAGWLFYGIGWIGADLSNRVQRSLARRHELLADATAVELHRLSDPLSRALRRVGGHPTGGQVRHARGRSMNHLFMVDARGHRTRSLHPDLRLRVLRLDPTWTGGWIRNEEAGPPSPPTWDDLARPQERRRPLAAPRPISAPQSPILDEIFGQTVPLGRAAEVIPTFEDLTAPLGSLAGPVSTALAYDLLAGPAVLPDVSPTHALASLVIVVHQAVGLVPTAATMPRGVPGLAEVITQRHPEMEARLPRERIAIVASAAASLREHGLDEAVLETLLDPLDARHDLDRWLVRRLIVGHLTPPPAATDKPRSLKKVRHDLALILTLVTGVGGGDRHTAFAVGASRAGMVGLLPVSDSSLGLGRIERSIDALADVDAEDRSRIMRGLEAAMAADGRRRRAEREVVEVVRLALQRSESATSLVTSP